MDSSTTFGGITGETSRQKLEDDHFTTTVLSNVRICPRCKCGHKTIKAVVQHLANTECNSTIFCYCGTLVTGHTASEHVVSCNYLGPIGCKLCPTLRFKCLERANNHAWSQHGNGKFTPVIQESVVLIMQAQGGTRYEHMQIEQIKERARNNTQKRTILKQLVMESNFAATDSKFSLLVKSYGANKTVPLFSRTQGRMHDVHVQLADFRIKVRINTLDKDFKDLWERLSPVIVLNAQGLFSIEHNVHHNTEGPVNDLAESLSKFMTSLSFEIPYIQRAISLCCKIVAMLTTRFKSTVVFALVCDIIVTSGLEISLARTIWEAIKDHCATAINYLRGGLFAQNSGLDPMASIATIIAILGGTVLMKKIPKDSEVNECLAGVTKLGSVVRGLGSAWTGLEKVCSYVIKKIYEWATGMPAETRELELYLDGIQKWFKEIQDMVSLTKCDEIAKNSETCIKLNNLYRDGLIYAQKAAESKAPREVLQPFNVHWSVLKNYYEKATASGAFRSGPRIEPLVIYLQGSSGMGKSGMMWPLAVELLNLDGIAQNSNGELDPMMDIYMRNVEQDYWDGYKNQRVVIYDDFAQIVDSAGNPNKEFMEIIRTGNIAPYPLHMATLEEKSKTYFNSRVVICTSNTKVSQIRPESIACPEAVRRRFDLVGEIEVKPEYATLRDGVPYLDPAKVKAITGEDKHCLDVYRIILIDSVTGRRKSGPYLTYKQFANMAVQHYRRRWQKATAANEFLMEYANQLHTDKMFAQERVKLEKEIAEANAKVKEAEANAILKAQALTAAEEDLWLYDMDSDVRLVKLQDMTSWNSEKILEFAEVYPELRHLFRDEIADKLDTFVNHIDMLDYDLFETSDAEDNAIVAQWTSTLQGADFSIWKNDAATRLREMVKKKPVLLYMIRTIVKELKQEVTRHSRALLSRLRSESKSWGTLVGDFCTKVKDSLSEHKYIAVALGCVPLICGAIALYFRGTSGDAVEQDGPLVGPAHEGLTRGSRVYHKHECMGCLKIFGHIHKIAPLKTSLGWGQICPECDRKEIVAFPQRYSDGESGFSVIYPGEQRIGKYNYEWYAEISGSGDPKTKSKKEKLTVELTASGDPRTKKKGNLTTEFTASGDPKTRNKKALRTEHELTLDSDDEFESDDYEPIAEVAEEMKAQLQRDPNAFAVSQKIIRNMYNMEMYKNGSYGTRIKVCFIRGRIALTAGHLIPCLEGVEKVRIWNHFAKDGHTIPIEQLKWKKVETAKGDTKDQMLICFPRSVHDHPDLLNSIATPAEMTRFATINGCLLTPSDQMAILRYGSVKSVDRERQYDDSENRRYSIRKSYEYSMETKDGECGSILMAISSGIARKIIGIHVAGGMGIGVSAPLNANDVLFTMRKLPMDAQVVLNVDELLRPMAASEQVNLPEGDFVPAGKAIFKVASPSKTALRESAVHGKVTPVITAPSALAPFRSCGTVIDPMKIGLKKAGAIPPPLDQKRLEIALNDVERIVNTAAEPDHQRILTDMESVTGVEGDPFLAPINRKSSPGFPLTKEKDGKPGKMKWLGEEDYKLDAGIQAGMREVIRNAKKNVRTPTIWTDTLKDERRPLAKVAAGKTRVFAAGPMVYTLAFRKYFLGFAAHCAKNRINNEISIGTNVYSYDWTRTANKLLTKGEKVIAGDFSNFDGTLILDMLAGIVDIVNKFYDDGEENATIRRVLWREIVNSVHVCGDDVYLWTHSQPSGCPITAILNSLYNSVSMRYVWLTVVPEEMKTMAEFNKHVSMVSYGDDNCVNISDAAIDTFNQVTIAQGYATIGMTYTDETKSGEMVPYRKLSEIGYLKRSFKWNEDEHQYIAPLDITVVLEMINWVRGDFDIESKTVENMETSAFELSLHGREVFNEWIEKYKNVSRQFEIRPMFLTYDEYRVQEAYKYGRLAGAC